MRKRKKGFTLIELLAVIVILSVILLIAVPKVFGYIESSRRSAFYTSVSNLVDNIKPENVLEEKDYCMYDYSKDKTNETELIKSMYVLTKMENGKIIYSVYAKSKNDDIINISDFSSTNISDVSTWSIDNQLAEGSYGNEVFKLLNNIKSGNSDALNLYVPCGVTN